MYMYVCMCHSFAQVQCAGERREAEEATDRGPEGQAQGGQGRFHQHSKQAGMCTCTYVMLNWGKKREKGQQQQKTSCPVPLTVTNSEITHLAWHA